MGEMTTDKRHKENEAAKSEAREYKGRQRCDGVRDKDMEQRDEEGVT